ncbi:MAG TPA: SDR family NAD(P)-dependent oxidoreductase [Ideonella sp.]|jgi:hypothetical protein|nr:SDR family NAD(P)-dependent oxidoreductase [Ideonella sp.]
MPTALVTGASSGIGEGLAERFARAGFDLVLVARRVEVLQALADRLAPAHGVKVRVLGADLAEAGAAQALAAQLRRRRVVVDVLVNNAGILAHGRFAEMKPAQVQGLIDLNIAGLTAMLAAFVPAMCERGQGRVLNVASIAAFQPVPTLAVYAASKAYVLSLSESLAEELRPQGVTVTALCPGITATPMLSGAQDANSALNRIPKLLVSQMEAVAELGFSACMRGDAIAVPGLLNRAGTMAGRALPKWLVRRMAGAVTRQLE